MTTADKAALILADISGTDAALKDVVGAGPFGPLIQALIAMLMQAVAGCGIAPAPAAAMFGQQTGLVGRLHKAMLLRVVNGGLKKYLKDTKLRAQLLTPITDAFLKQGPTTTADDVTTMTAEAPDVLATMAL